MTDVNTQRKQLRQTLRTSRNALSQQQQQQASEALKNRCIEFAEDYSVFALYLHNDGEINPALAIDALWRRDKQVCLPVMHGFRNGYLNFQIYEHDMALPTFSKHSTLYMPNIGNYIYKICSSASGNIKGN